jgi:hypothetical protein
MEALHVGGPEAYRKLLRKRYLRRLKRRGLLAYLLGLVRLVYLEARLLRRLWLNR